MNSFFKYSFSIILFLFCWSSFVLANDRVIRRAVKEQNVFDADIEMDFRLGSHIQPAKDLSTARTGLSLTQKINFSKYFKMSLGGRYENEAVYSWLPRNYAMTELRKTQSNVAWVTDTYLKLKWSSLVTTVGYQQVIWGETFGNNISDIVNPKDYRELTLETPSRSRLQVPMLNLQWLNLGSSVQVIYIPSPQFNRMPKMGSEFAIKIPDSLSGTNVILDEKDPDHFSRGEWGARISKQFSNLDMALFYFNYFDRMPIYEIVPDPAIVNTIHLLPHHRPLRSYGINLTFDLNGYLIRAEGVYSPLKSLNTVTNLGITEAQFNKLDCIGGLDFPPFWKSTLSLQYSEELLQTPGFKDYLPSQKRLDISLTKNFKNDRTLETVMSLYTMDGSGLYQIKYHLPITQPWELEFGMELFGGSTESTLGKYIGVSRVLTTLKGNW